MSSHRPAALACAAVAVLVASGCGSKDAAKVKTGTIPLHATGFTYAVGNPAMEPTLHCGAKEACGATLPDRVELAAGSPKLNRGDIVVFKPPKAARRCHLTGDAIARVVGLPGETWSEKHGIVYIDGKKLDEPYVLQILRGKGDHGDRKIGSGSYFVMGDNRKASCDSRAWGPLAKQSVVGRVAKILRP
jgi:signal peptidase I